MNQAENRTPGNVPEQRTYKVEDIAVMLNIGRIVHDFSIIIHRPSNTGKNCHCLFYY